MLTKGSIKSGSKTYPVVDIAIVPYEESKPEFLEFDWSATKMTDQAVTFKLLFKTAMYVSASGEPDIIRITFRDPYMFIGENDLAISKEDFGRRLL